MFPIKKRYIFIIALMVVTVIFSITVFFNVPDLSVEKITEISQTLKIYDKNQKLSAELNGGQMRQSISIKNVPQHVIDALIATEDIRFYEHNGIDIKRIFGALISDISSGSLKEGASTITQQLIKNSHLTSEKTFTRKINEAILALQLERRYKKDEILEMYFNFVYFGRGAYGIQEASKVYFGIDAKELSVSQGALLVGILKAPSKYAPHLNMENAKNRRKVVLSQMKKYGYISEEDFLKYSDEEIIIVEKISHPDYGYYTDYVLEESAKKLNISVSDLLGGGYNIYTTLDATLQEDLQKIYEDDNNFPDKSVQSSSVIIENESGSISAMIGGREHQGMRVFNRALARRQPGSCIKPLLVYGPAFENGLITSATILDDYRKDFSGYTPTNYKNVYYGNITVRRALALSLNVPAVEILEKNGIEYSKLYAQKAGIKFDENDKYLALALGGMTYGASPLEIASAYSMLGRNGTYIEPWCIEKITDSNGNVLYLHNEKSVKVFSESTAFLLTDILCDVSKQESNGLNILQVPIACKTGTVGYGELGHSDAWTASYTKTHSVCVWMGYDKTDENNLLQYEVTGSAHPARISAKIYECIFKNYQYVPFDVPQSVVKVKIDLYTLNKTGEIYLASENQKSVLNEYFDISKAPYKTNDYWDTPSLPQNITVQLNELRQAEISFNASNDFTQYVIYKGDNEISRLFGNGGEKLSYTDENYVEGDKYVIQPIHKEVYVSGKPLSGRKSGEISIH